MMHSNEKALIMVLATIKSVWVANAEQHFTESFMWQALHWDLVPGLLQFPRGCCFSASWAAFVGAWELSLGRLWQPDAHAHTHKKKKKTWIGDTHVISRCYGNPHSQEDIPESPWLNSQRRNKPLESLSASARHFTCWWVFMQQLEGARANQLHIWASRFLFLSASRGDDTIHSKESCSLF